jgi:hypothetical protein
MTPKDTLAEIHRHAGIIQKLALTDDAIKHHANEIRRLSLTVLPVVERTIAEINRINDVYRAAGVRQIEAERNLNQRIEMAGVKELTLDGISPHGFYVYVLYGHDGQVQYVGQSTNILSRLGSHMGARWKRDETARVKLIECAHQDQMKRLEAVLIRRFTPPWNTFGIPYAVLADRRKAKASQSGEQGELASGG